MIEMGPPWPPAALPDAIVMAPELWPDALPVETSIAPLYPSCPELAVVKDMPPLDIRLLVPVPIATNPPTTWRKPDSPTLPAWSNIAPPSPDVPVPTDIVIEPPVPPSAFALDIMMLPELPRLPVPVAKVMVPLEPRSPLLAVINLRSPLEPPTLSPLNNLIEPPNAPAVVLPATTSMLAPFLSAPAELPAETII
jgi:hypothetical protein